EHLAHHHRDAEQLAGLLDRDVAIAFLRRRFLFGGGCVGLIHRRHSVDVPDPEQTGCSPRTGPKPGRATPDRPGAADTDGGEPPPGQLNDTVTGITVLLGLNGTTGSPVQNPTGGSTGSTQTGGTTGRSSSTSSTTSGARSHVGSSGLTVLDGIGVITPGQSF